MTNTNRVQVRGLKGDELGDIARCYRTCPEWAAEYKQRETEEIILDACDVLAIDVAPSEKSTTLYAIYMAGCATPLFIQARGDDGRVHEVQVEDERAAKAASTAKNQQRKAELEAQP